MESGAFVLTTFIRPCQDFEPATPQNIVTWRRPLSQRILKKVGHSAACVELSEYFQKVFNLD